MSDTTKNTIPRREEVPLSDRWDLSALYSSPEAWEAGLKEYESRIPGIENFRGTLGKSP